MLFFESRFLGFFLVVFLVHWALPWHRVRLGWLLAASCVFYMSWNPWFILLIFASTSVDYFVALRLERTTVERDVDCDNGTSAARQESQQPNRLIPAEHSPRLAAFVHPPIIPGGRRAGMRFHAPWDSDCGSLLDRQPRQRSFQFGGASVGNARLIQV